MSKIVLFIDAKVTDYETLLAGLSSDVEVYLLNAEEDGVLQMANILKNRTDLDSIQILSHGSSGALSLGSGFLNNDNLSFYADALAKIGSALSEAGDLLLYGCDVAQGDNGLNFINQLAAITGADVAASDDLTGNTALGGNWILETNAGAIETASINPGSGYDSLLALAPLLKVTITAGTNPVEGGTVGTFTITLDSPSAADLVINYTLSGLATLTTDYSVGAGTNTGAVTANTFTIAAGQTSATLNITAANDAVSDPNETVTLALASGAGYQLAAAIDSSFVPKTDVGVGNRPASIISADFNGDGKLDLATANWSSNDVSIRLGDGSGSFSGTTTVSVGTTPYSVISADFNGDGKLDLATANAVSNNVSVLLGDGSGGFSGSTTVPVNSAPLSVTSADFNGDGKLDLAIANAASNDVSIRLRDGPDSFSVVGSYPTSIISADFNGDGKLDLATANGDSNDVSIRLGDGSGGFSGTTTVSVGTDPRSVISADFNGDGKLDLAIANKSDNNVSVRFGNGSGSFSGTTTVSVGTTPTSVISADFNGDGKLDLATANYKDNTVSVRLGDGSGGFSGTTTLSVGSFPYSVISADFNGDGKLDLATANEGSNTVSVLLNTAAPTATLTIVDALVNNAPVVTAGAITAFTEQTPLAVASAITVNDVNGDADWNGGSLKIQITDNNTTADDGLALPTINNGGIWLNTTGNELMSNTTAIGSANAVVVSNDSAWTLTFNAAATNALVQSTAQAITFTNSSDTPSTTARTVTFTATDKNGSSGFATQTVSVTAVNDAPILTSFTSTVASGNKDNEMAVTFTSLQTQGDEADVDGTVDSFAIKSVSSGSLKIGSSPATAIAWDAGTNNTVNASLNAYWTPAVNANGVLNAFTAVAMDDGGLESDTPIQATVTVATNIAPTLSTFAAPVASGDEDNEMAVTFTSLQAQGDEVDVDGTVDSFVIKAVSSGSLKIGSSAATATAWNASINNTVNASLNAYWTPAINANGVLNAFTAVAIDDGGLESDTPIQATVTVATNTAPTLSTFAAPVASGDEDNEMVVTFTDLRDRSDAVDVDGTVDSFEIKAVSSGSLKIGSSPATAIAWDAGANNTVNADLNAYWTPDTDANGVLDAFAAVAKDNGGLESVTPIQATVTVAAINETPTNLAISAYSINEGVEANSIVGTLSSADPDAGNTFTYSLATGGDNDAFTIVGDQLEINSSPNFDTQSSYSILVRTTDQDGLFFDKALSIGINNVITGSEDNDTLDGGDSNDAIDGGEGSDAINGGAGDDFADGGEGDDAIDGGEGSDTIDGGEGSDAIEGGAGDDVADGGVGSDSIDGGTGNDIINGGEGINVLIGGAGIDTLDYSHFTEPVTVDLSKKTKQKTSANSTDTLSDFENLDGSPYDDKLTGSKASNVFEGGGGNDTIDGGAGSDTLVLDGTKADYSFSVSKGLKSPFEPFTFTGLKTTDVIEIATSKNNKIKTVGIEKIKFTGEKGTVDLNAKNPQALLYNAATYNNDSLVGTAGNDSITGGQGNDTLDGGAGNDTLIGGVGNDTFKVDSISDVVTELAVKGSGTDTINLAATYAADTYSLADTNVEKLSASLLVAAIAITGNSGNNTITGGVGNDTLDGGAGADNLVGGLGNDTYIIDSGKDKITESSKSLTEIDTVQSSIKYTLGSNLENLTLAGSDDITGFGNALGNSLVGNDGKNNLKGNAGNDILDGGAGADSLDGGAGNDTLIYDSADSKIDGGAGNDLLKLSGSGITLNLSQLTIGKTTGIEKLDLTGTGSNSLLVNVTKLVNLTGSAGHKLYVIGDADDSVTLTGAMWTDNGVAADGYHQYIHITGAVTDYYLYVLETVAQTLE